MDRNSVIIKSNSCGLILLLDGDLPFPELLQDVARKFQESAHFFKNAKMAVTFRGRTLTPQQERELVETITANCGLHILCIVDEDRLAEGQYRRILDHAGEEEPKNSGFFYHGTLRTGQVLKTEQSLVILGDVNPGANVISAGSVVVLGSCRGNIYVGATGDRSCFVAALVLKPNQIRIADKTVRSAITKRTDTGEYETDPKIASVVEGHISLRELTQEALQDLTAEENTDQNDKEE